MNGAVLKQLRNIYGYNAAEMSKALGITTNYLYEIERSQRRPSQDLIEKYARLFELKPSSIMLLSEAYENDSDKPAGSDFIRKMMINAIQREIKKLEKKSIALYDSERSSVRFPTVVMATKRPQKTKISLRGKS